MRFLVFDTYPGHPRFGELIPCPVCGADLQQTMLERMSGLSPELRRWTFATTDRIPGKNDLAYDAACALVLEPRWFFTLTGSHGVGKTRLLACLVNAGRDARWPSIYSTAAELLDHLRSAYAPNAPHSIDELWEHMVTAKILIIDELDLFNATPWAATKFMELIDLRYRYGESRLTAFATNASLDDLDPGMVSRMRDRRCALFHLGGRDLRSF